MGRQHSQNLSDKLYVVEDVSGHKIKKRMFYLQEEILIRREEFFYQALYLEEYLNNVVIYCVHPFYILCVNVNVSPSVYQGAGRTS